MIKLDSETPKLSVGVYFSQNKVVVKAGNDRLAEFTVQEAAQILLQAFREKK
jgi:hypothetical protein